MEFSVLIADDDDDDVVLISTHIKQCNQNVVFTVARNGQEATEKLTAGLHPTLIIVDANMPVMDGYELLVWLMNSTYWRHIPVVSWTGEISDRDVTGIYQLGANAVLLKQNALQSVEAFCNHWFELVQLPEPVAIFRG